MGGLFGSKPVVPDLPSLSLPVEQQKALAANLAAIPQAEQIAGRVNLFNQQQLDQMLENVIPNYKALTTDISQNISQMAAGQVPTDVQGQIQRSAAARALGGGYAGTEAQKNLVARDLGLTSLDLTQKGLASAESWMRTASSIYEPGMFNVTSMFVSPAQQAGFDVAERQSQFQRQWMQNQISAMPDPTAVGIWNATWSVVDAALSAYTGSSVDLGRISTQGSMGGGGMSFGGGGGGGGGGGFSLGGGGGGGGGDTGGGGFSLYQPSPGSSAGGFKL
jgi:hypothetical protein